MDRTLHLSLTAVFEPAEEGGFLSRFAEFPDVFSQGESLEEAKENLYDALDLVMDYHRRQATASQPEGTVREVVELVPQR